ncbi:MAG: hypothetical protein DHS80DRAFT_29083 [Piptocephalis tieghemiana]|nr:MAG: hypothetical protein DHS80DRAFT_29083 [Piptocephalis tieghemiana]
MSPATDLTNRLDRLKAWFQEHAIYVAPSLELRSHPADPTSLGVFALKDLSPGDLVCGIPRTAVLSAVNSGIANLLEDEAIGGGIALTLAVMFEKSRGESSPWAGYFQSLPPKTHLPVFWTEEERALLQGTELETAVRTDEAHIQEDYTTVVQPLIQAYPSTFPAPHFTLEVYREVSSVVASRAFQVDNYHEDAMVPLADVFNHKTKGEHVHLENDGEVCPACGAGDGCIHHSATDDDDDEEDEDEDEGEGEEVEEDQLDSLIDISPSSDSDSDSEDAYPWLDEERSDVNSLDTDAPLEMRIVRACKAGQEVYNTYGDQGNAYLLGKYGFAERDNPCTVVAIGWDVLRPSLEQVFSPEQVEAKATFFFDRYFHLLNEEEEEEEEEEEKRGREEVYFGVDRRGCVEEGLLVLLVLMACKNPVEELDEEGARSLMVSLKTKALLAFPVDGDSSKEVRQKAQAGRDNEVDIKLRQCMALVLQARLDLYEANQGLGYDEGIRRLEKAKEGTPESWALMCRLNEQECLQRALRVNGPVPAASSAPDRSTGASSKKTRAAAAKTPEHRRSKKARR